ncbi:alkaline phosphatase D family protein [Agitococcus lubricus]|uniref:PhoD-like phosphatase domain-containing protein n=1 Tax=Agitococcus lubricus TaxID=1077255 RepID=A0A2T5IZW1_9GAMM|nr:alkaline phosphatase D family protein [Agitococcus lubricus]PTQ89597.1 hypothetical protein C8N29_106128 [Agitococcus lubricus]
MHFKSDDLLIGPILGYEGSDNSGTLHYTVCVLVKTEPLSIKLTAKWRSQGQPPEPLLRAKEKTISGTFYRFELSVKQPIGTQGEVIDYVLHIDNLDITPSLYANMGGNSFCFYVPAKQENPKIAYGSCNGFEPKSKDTSTPIWNKLYQHQITALYSDTTPFSLLLMGGDQVYADSLFNPYLKDTDPLFALQTWLNKEPTLKPKPQLAPALDKAYIDIYQRAWGNTAVRRVLACIPSLMMWDDHDIFDGWGSYEEGWCDSEIGQLIFTAASKAFCCFQLRLGQHNRTLLNSQPPNREQDFSWRVNLNNIDIVALDNRSQRTLRQIMSKEQWQRAIQAFQPSPEAKLMYVMVGVPPVYQRFEHSLEKVLLLEANNPKNGNLDDLRDHWNASHHEAERDRLFYSLDAINAQIEKVVILSGDVHVGGFGQVKGKRTVYQLISSALQYTAPSLPFWLGLRAISSTQPLSIHEDRLQIHIVPVPVANANEYLRMRNFAWLQLGTDNYLWFNWVAEDGIQRYLAR